MTKFETIGVERQRNAVDKHDAAREFQISCTICCNHGCYIDCDRCAINATHTEVVAIFDDIAARTERRAG